MSETSLTLKRSFNATPERVFAAFTRAEALQGWFGPQGMTVPSARVDARPGGAYRIEMHAPGGAVFVVVGEFREVVPPERLAFTFASLNGAARGPETLVTLSLVATEYGTELTLVHSGFSTLDLRDRHQHGWASNLENLAATLDGLPQPTEPHIILLGDPRSSYVRSARMAFFEKGISHRLEPARPHSPPVEAIHPMGRIPVLKCGEFTLFETSAIMRYVDEAFPGPALMPEAPAGRARAEQWISAINCYFFDAMSTRSVRQFFLPTGPDGKPDRAVIDPALGETGKHLATLERAYAGRSWLVGERLTLADLLLAPIIFYLRQIPEGAGLLANFPPVLRAHEAMAERASFAAAAAAFGT